MRRRGGSWQWFGLGLVCLVRLHHIDAPLLGTNSWRQVDNAIVARNFHAHGFRLLYPETDRPGPGPRWVQMEFPAYQYAVALLYSVVGVQDGLGRWLSLLASLVGSLALYRLCWRWLDHDSALWAAVCFALLPLNAYYGRAFMVESTMLACLILGVWSFDRWLTEDSVPAFWLAAGALALACLLKVVSLYIGAVLVHAAWVRLGPGWWRRPALWGLAALILVPVWLWYAHSITLFNATGFTLMGDWRYGTDKWGTWGALGTWDWWNRLIFKRLAEKHVTWVGFLALVAGLAMARRHATERIFDTWLLAVILYSMIVSRGAYIHEHYQLPFVPPAAAVIGKAFGRFRTANRGRRWVAALRGVLAVALVLAAVWRYAAMSAMEDPEESEPYRLAMRIRTHVAAGRPVVTVDNYDPTDLYHADRPGWCTGAEEIVMRGDAYLTERMREGAVYFAGRYALFAGEGWESTLRALLARRGSRVFDDGQDFIVRLKPPAR